MYGTGRLIALFYYVIGVHGRFRNSKTLSLLSIASIDSDLYEQGARSRSPLYHTCPDEGSDGHRQTRAAAQPSQHTGKGGKAQAEEPEGFPLSAGTTAIEIDRSANCCPLEPTIEREADQFNVYAVMSVLYSIDGRLARSISCNGLENTP